MIIQYKLEENLIAFIYDDYEEHNFKISVFDIESKDMIIFNEELCENNYGIEDKVYINIHDEYFKIIKEKEISSFIYFCTYLKKINQLDSSYLVHFYKNCLNTFNHKHKWIDIFKQYRNNDFLDFDGEPFTVDIPITIYRGCYESEINTKEYGISWTYDKQIASCFNEYTVELETTLDKVIGIIGGHEKEIIYEVLKDDIIKVL